MEPLLANGNMIEQINISLFYPLVSKFWYEFHKTLQKFPVRFTICYPCQQPSSFMLTLAFTPLFHLPALFSCPLVSHYQINLFHISPLLWPQRKTLALSSCSLKYGMCTVSISITWELLRIAKPTESQSASQQDTGCPLKLEKHCLKI